MNDTPETNNERTLKIALEVFTELAKTLKQERDEAREAIRALAEHGESEIQRITKERDEAREVLMKIEDLFIDGTDIYADRENMGIIARNALGGVK
jgi:hypothetical protein